MKRGGEEKDVAGRKTMRKNNKKDERRTMINEGKIEAITSFISKVKK